MNPDHILALSVLLFCIGLIGLISRRNFFVTYMAIELMLNSVNLIFVTFARARTDAGGSVIALLMIGVIAAEAALFLAMMVQLYRKQRSIDSDDYTNLAQKNIQ